MLRRVAVILLVGLVPALTACPAIPNPFGDRTSWRAQLFDAINTQRVRAGVPPLAACGNLGVSAQGHSADQAATSTLSHTGSDGTSTGDRANRAGYVGWSNLAENVAFGQTTVDQVMWAWMSSPTHRANILNRSFTHTGFGRATSPSGVDYWTEDFAVGGSC